MGSEEVLTKLASFAVIFCLVLFFGWLVWTRRTRGHLAAKTPPVEKIEAPSSPAEIDAFAPSSHFIEVDGVRVHYLQDGVGSDVVLIHGIGASLFIWRFVFPLLHLRHRITAIDLPGFGKSSKDPRRNHGLDSQTEIVAKVLTAIGIEKATLVGSSMGGAISLWLAKLYPERFQDVAVLAPATDRRLVPGMAHHMALAAPFLRYTLNRRTMRVLLGRIVTRQDLITDEVVESYLEPFLESGHGVRTFWGAMRLLSDARLPKALVGLKARVLIVYGENDRLVPRRSIDELGRILPDAELVTHPTAGHHIMEDEPEWTADILDRFFAASEPDK